MLGLASVSCFLLRWTLARGDKDKTSVGIPEKQAVNVFGKPEGRKIPKGVNDIVTLDRKRCIDLMEIVSKSCIDVFELRFGGVEIIFDRRQMSDSADEKYLCESGDFTVEVLSPVLGMCRIAPSDGALPYVQVGQAVCEHDIICSIDVLEKKFDVPAGASGIIMQLNTRGGELIEYKQQLAIIQAIR